MTITTPVTFAAEPDQTCVRCDADDPILYWLSSRTWVCFGCYLRGERR